MPDLWRGVNRKEKEELKITAKKTEESIVVLKQSLIKLKQEEEILAEQILEERGKRSELIEALVSPPHHVLMYFIRK